MNRTVGLISPAGVGAGLMYLFDPDRGKGRRAEICNRAKHLNRVGIQVAGKTERDLRNRWVGIFAQFGSLFRSEEA